MQDNPPPIVTNLEVHDDAMRTMGKHFRVFTRIGRWGRCGACAEDGRGDYYPEFCENTARYDHQLNLEGLVSQYGSWMNDAREKLQKHRDRELAALR